MTLGKRLGNVIKISALPFRGQRGGLWSRPRSWSCRIPSSSTSWLQTKAGRTLKKKKKKISALADCHLVKLLSSHRGWEIEALSFLMITFQKDDCRFLRKTFLACSWLVDFHFRGERERLYSCKFSKVCVLRK